MNVIGISGKKLSGKTTLAYDMIYMALYKIVWRGKMPMSLVLPVRKICVLPLALHLKKSICSLFGLSIYDMEINKNAQLDIQSLFTQESITYRQLLQEFGSDIVRNMKPNLWIEHIDQVATKNRYKTLIIPDIRFENEVDYCKSKGGIVIHLEGRGQSGDNHSSENSIGKSDADIVIHNQNMSRENQAKDAIYAINNHFEKKVIK